MLTYRDKELKQKYRADFIYFEKIIIELKATSELIKEHESQIINYLDATKFKLVRTSRDCKFWSSPKVRV